MELHVSISEDAEQILPFFSVHYFYLPASVRTLAAR